MKEHIQNILMMRSSTVKNYVIPGLNSSLLEKGKVRLFECSRDHQEAINPHSHRFNFSCYVLSGSVINRIWSKDRAGDLFMLSELEYCGEIGSHKKSQIDTGYYSFSDTQYLSGEWYSMNSTEIHSIFFSKGATVLFFEGAEVSNKSLIIEPFINDKVVSAFHVSDWMFEKEPKS